MARTVNRQPASVGYPSKNDRKNYFFNHYTWKGINDDKNFLEVDQETFQEAENVYVDSEGLLRSRPALKNKNVVLKDQSDNNVSIDTISDFRVFGDIYVYINDDDTDEKTYLYFCNKKTDELYYIDSSHLYTFAYNYVNHQPIDYKLILSRRKVFIFTNSSFDYFDIDTLTFGSAVDFIYIPTTKTITTNTIEDVEAPNPLTNQEIYTYLYSNTTGVNINIYGKTVKLEINGVEYEVTFTQNTPFVLARVYNTISSGYNDGTTINMAVSKDNVCAIYNETNRTMSMSIDGLVFKSYVLPTTAGTVLSPVKFSKDGSLVYIVTTTGIWWLSVYADNSTGVKLYPSFVNVKSVYPAFDPLTQSDSVTVFSKDVFSVEILEDCKILGWFADKDTDLSPFCYFVIFDGTTLSRRTIARSSFSSLVPDHFLKHSLYCTKSYTVNYNGSDIQVDQTLLCSLGGTLAILAYTSSDIYCIFASAHLITYGTNNSEADIKDDGDTVYITTYSREYLTNNGMIEKLHIDFEAVSDLSLVSSVTNVLGGIVQGQYAKIPYNYSILDQNVPPMLLNDGKVVCNIGIVDFVSYKLEHWINGTEDDNTGYKLVHILAATNYTYYFVTLNDADNSTVVYITNIDNPIALNVTEITKYDDNNQPILYNYIVPEHDAELHNFYLSDGNKVYITDDRFDDNKQWLWYLAQQQQFNYHITGLHPISDSVMGVFMENEVDYIMYDSDKGAYLYQKSKLQLGLPNGNNIITSLDGTTVLFVTKRGLVAMGYQDFIASTEQALSYLSDGIYQLFDDWNKAPIRLMLHGFWLICYKPNDTDCYVYDIRTKSWWHCEYSHDLTTKFVEDENKLYYLGESELYTLSIDDTEYYDTLGSNKYPIDWRISSQKLYLNAVNYYKHIVNLTFNISLHNAMTVQGEEVPQDYTMNLDVCNYRKERNIVSTENFGYKIDMIRTCIKRLNYAKVCEFQYRLSADLDKYVETQVPLSLADVTVKYKIAGQVR